jgi:hypothetical protein
MKGLHAHPLSSWHKHHSRVVQAMQYMVAHHEKLRGAEKKLRLAGKYLKMVGKSGEKWGGGEYIIMIIQSHPAELKMASSLLPSG